MTERQIPTEQQPWFMAAIASVSADSLASVVRNRTLQLLFTLLGSDTWPIAVKIRKYAGSVI